MPKNSLGDIGQKDRDDMDEIRIENLDVFAHHGVFPEETRDGQHFLVSAILYTDTKEAGRSDDLDKSTDYGAVCHTMDSFLREHTYLLLEAAAEYLAEEILHEYPLIRRLSLEIRKPQAPIDLPFGCVSVKITRGWKKALIALGSNLGDKRAYISYAIDEIKKDTNCRILRVSDLITTKPYGGVEQDDFVNGALVMETLYSPGELLDFLHTIEQGAGRKREIHWGPRTLDLDIILYEEQIIEREELSVPHIDMQNRDFVLIPAAQIAGRWIHPVLGRSIQDLLDDLNGRTKK